MNFSPLRKQVQSLNQQLENQNIQIKDLIGFLNKSKSTPKSNFYKSKSPQLYGKKIQNCINNINKSQRYINKKQKIFETNHSFKDIKIGQSIKKQFPCISKCRHSLCQLQKQCIQKNKVVETAKCNNKLIKSITYHNIQNATLTNRKYLNLSNPVRKLNVSCSFCKDSTDKNHYINDFDFTYKNLQKSSNKENIIFKSTNKEKKINENIDSKKSNTIVKDTSKKNLRFKNSTEESNKKRHPLKSLNEAAVLSKNQVKSFIEKKSTKYDKKSKQIKQKLKLGENERRQSLKFLTKR